MAFGDNGFADSGTSVGQRGRGSNNNRGGNSKKKRNNNNRNGGGGGGGGGNGVVDDPFAPADIGGGLFGTPLATVNATTRGTSGAGGLSLPTTFAPGGAGGTGISSDPFATPTPGPRGGGGIDFGPPASGGGTPLPPGTPPPVAGGLGGAVTPGNVGGEPGGSGSIFTDETSAVGSGDPENYRNVAWGLLNQAGIMNDPFFGSNAADWLDQKQIEDWYTQWQGMGNLAGHDAPTWAAFLEGLPGVAAPATAPDLNWIIQNWGPAMRQGLAARFYAQTPRNRGYDSTRYRAPGRVVTY